MNAFEMLLECLNNRLDVLLIISLAVQPPRMRAFIHELRILGERARLYEMIDQGNKEAGTEYGAVNVNRRHFAPASRHSSLCAHTLTLFQYFQHLFNVGNLMHREIAYADVLIGKFAISGTDDESLIRKPFNYGGRTLRRLCNNYGL